MNREIYAQRISLVNALYIMVVVIDGLRNEQVLEGQAFEYKV
jgi:hypothetical protein